jgi:hypothetical protein
LVSTSTISRVCANTNVFSPDLIAMRAMRLACDRADARRPRSGLQHVLVAGRRAGLRDRVNLGLDQRARVLGRVADRRRAQDELRRHAVERADPLEPAQHVGDVAAEHTPIRVDLVDHHVAQVLEELRPLGVVRQDRLVEHVGVGDDDVAVQADRLARVARGVAVESEGLHPEVAGIVELQQFGHLVLRQRLGREQVEGLGVALHRRADHRQGVAQRLARRGRGDNGDVFATLRCVPGVGLVAVEPVDAAGAQGGSEGGGHVVGDRCVVALAAGEGEVAGDAIGVAPGQRLGQCGTVAAATVRTHRQRSTRVEPVELAGRFVLPHQCLPHALLPPKARSKTARRRNR